MSRDRARKALSPERFGWVADGSDAFGPTRFAIRISAIPTSLDLVIPPGAASFTGSLPTFPGGRAGSSRIGHRCESLGEVPNDTSNSDSEAQRSSRKVTGRLGDSER